MTIRDSVLYIALRILKKSIEIAPLSLALLFGKTLGIIAYHLVPNRREITYNNIKRAFPLKDEKWCRDITFQVFSNMGRNIIEFIKYASGRFNNHVDVEDLEKFDNGAILLMGHMGNWEIAGMTIPASGRELYPIGRRIHSKAFDMIVDDIRTTYGSYHIHYRGGMKQVLKKIRQKKNICVLVDQRIKSGLPVHFFNRPVYATHIVPILSRKTKADVVPGYSRHIDGRLKVVFEESMKFEEHEDVLKTDFINTQKQMDWLESKVREKPDEWFWMHNFWKDKWPAVFLDRDGTINVDHGYVSEKKNFEFYPGVFDSLRKLRQAGFLLVIVTNQSGIARGLYSQHDYDTLTEYVQGKFREEGVIIDQIYYCNHHPDDNCHCRKPGTGMLEDAIREFNIDPSRSYMIGDKKSDIGAGKNLGMRTVIVKTGYGKEHMKEAEPDVVAEDIKDAAEKILNEKD